MKNKKVLTFKGITILENIIAFVLLISALTIAGTGFYTAGGYINRGHMYEEAADKVQCMLESGEFDSVIEAFNGSGTVKYDQGAVYNSMRALGYKLSSDRSFYYNTSTWVVVKPYSTADGTSSDYKSSSCIAASEDINNDKLRKLPGTYLYICVPVDANQIADKKKQGYNEFDAIGLSDYVPLMYYTGNWPYADKK